ncbi:VPA1262 family N-terminal domain-containing protein [Mucilaginibacter sp. KACC 22773]|uniref:VPA1262 family N-terminal domain-containing protein n=1 Tax=Mucilaginibacter sp. KACC 22773 TaxID=3025671 RepID=UPI0023651593|nr:VPA1262 family N-terminal domain-containing protein [Mucilaginibacter sp. KACC 22773]WDF79762.1 VPA1262 family N-terminal domain-containing protein [Mucilaginibacter sp. KACC 22773]
MQLFKDFETLIAPGNVGFFYSCEVTQLFIQHKKNKTVTNLFILASFEEKQFEGTAHRYLTKLLPVNKELAVGIQRYWLSPNEAQAVFGKLVNKHKWDFSENDQLVMGKLSGLAKQFIPASEGNRLNHVLKNNFHNGSYILEFFDESKQQLEFLLDVKAVKSLNKLTEQIKEIVPIDLSLVRDRLGNVIFQFPVTILKTTSQSLTDHTGVVAQFKWHLDLVEPKACTIMVDSILDGNYLGSVNVPYNLSQLQLITTGHVDQVTNIRIWSNEPNLLLSNFRGTYFRGMSLNTSIGSHEPRVFTIGGVTHKVEIVSKGMRSGDSDVQDYATFIHNTLYDAEKVRLESSLSFKQYFSGSSLTALQDLRKLINQHDQNGVCLWDPYLRSGDILNTLFFSPTAGVEIKAIGAIEKSSKKILSKTGYTTDQIIRQESAILEDPGNNNYGLKLEFRLQHSNHGWSFHDRFLIFPGSKRTKPKVYSIGTSINSIGLSHHILLEVSHPQRVIDAFDELWEKLDHKDCLVWRSK